MGAKHWTPKEQRHFINNILPRSNYARGYFTPHEGMTFAELALIMQVEMGKDAKREYTRDVLFQHWYQTVRVRPDSKPNPTTASAESTPAQLAFPENGGTSTGSAFSSTAGHSLPANSTMTATSSYSTDPANFQARQSHTGHTHEPNSPFGVPTTSASPRRNESLPSFISRAAPSSFQARQGHDLPASSYTDRPISPTPFGLPAASASPPSNELPNSCSTSLHTVSANFQVRRVLDHLKYSVYRLNSSYQPPTATGSSLRNQHPDSLASIANSAGPFQGRQGQDVPGYDIRRSNSEFGHSTLTSSLQSNPSSSSYPWNSDAKLPADTHAPGSRLGSCTVRGGAVIMLPECPCCRRGFP